MQNRADELHYAMDKQMLFPGFTQVHPRNAHSCAYKSSAFLPFRDSMVVYPMAIRSCSVSLPTLGILRSSVMVVRCYHGLYLPTKIGKNGELSNESDWRFSFERVKGWWKMYVSPHFANYQPIAHEWKRESKLMEKWKICFHFTFNVPVAIFKWYSHYL